MEGSVELWLVRVVGCAMALYLAHWAWRFYRYRQARFAKMVPADFWQKKKRQRKTLEFEEGFEGVSVGFAIMAPFSQFFSGKLISQVVRDFGLERTAEGYYQLLAPDGERVFCVMTNIHKPGIFAEDLPTMPEIEGVMLWQYLPQSTNVLRDFDDFFAIAHEMAKSMGGNLCNRKRKKLLANEHQVLREEVRRLQARYLAYLSADN